MPQLSLYALDALMAPAEVSRCGPIVAAPAVCYHRNDGEPPDGRGRSVGAAVLYGSHLRYCTGSRSCTGPLASLPDRFTVLNRALRGLTWNVGWMNKYWSARSMRRTRGLDRWSGPSANRRQPSHGRMAMRIRYLGFLAVTASIASGVMATTLSAQSPSSGS
jgi:hypothetical protein